MRFISALEVALGKEAEKINIGMQTGSVISNYADVSDSERDNNFNPATSIEEGLKRFVDWYLKYYNIKG